ncbi:glycosyltransferase family 2 protein [Gammaproteobacteria bacterium]|nr:glycosyltransferase family 2 protein [Gammaproteobacteria bacterium]
MKNSQDSVRSWEISDQRLEGSSIVRALDLPESYELFFLNWPLDAAAQTLEKTIKSSRLFSTVDELLDSLKHHQASNFTVSSAPRDENSLNKGDFKEQDAIIIFADLFFAAQSHREIFFTEILPIILTKGGLVITRRDWNKSSELDGSTDLIADNVDRSIQTERVLAFPSIEDPSFLFREEFLYEKEDAWRGVAEFLDETGRPREFGSSPIPELWPLFRTGNQFPTQNAPNFSVFYDKSCFPKSPVSIDFLKISAGVRKAKFWIETKKPRGQDEVIRRALYPASTASDFIETKSPLTFRHTPSNEPYRSGQTLAALWLSALAPNGSLNQLRGYFFDYYSFLKQNVGDSDFNNFDLIPDNLMLDRDGTINPIDQEWEIADSSFTPDVAFCRGLFYFLLRFSRRLDIVDLARQFGPCHRDFLHSAIEWLGIDVDRSVNTFFRIEKEFRESTLECYAAVEPESLLYRRFGDPEVTHLKWLQIEKSEAPSTEGMCPAMNTLFLPANSGRAGASVSLSTFCSDSSGCVLFIFFPEHFGNPRFESLRAHSSSFLNSVDILNLVGHEKVIECFENLNDKDQKLLQQDGDFASSRVVKIDLKLNLIDRKPDLFINWEIKFLWPDLTYGPNGDHELLSRLWGKERAYSDACSQIAALDHETLNRQYQINALEQKLNQILSSKAWRVAEILRKVIFAFKPKPTAKLDRPPTAIELLSRPAIEPKSQFKIALNQKSFAPVVPERSSEQQPLISIVMPVHNTPRPWLRDAVDSVRSQSYRNWELVIVNDGSTLLETREYLDKLDEPRVSILNLTSSSGISGATNFGIEASRGDIVALMDHDDMLAKDALAHVVTAFSQQQAELVYSDETVFNDDMDSLSSGYFGSPILKPDYSPDLLLSHNYVTHFLAARKELIEAVGGLRSEFDGAQDYDLILRLTELTDNIIHIAEPLYHWRQSTQSTSLDTGVKPEAHLRGKKALAEALARRDIKGKVLTGNAPHFFRVKHEIISNPSVDIVIPFRDQPLMLQQCIDSLLTRTSYSNFRIIGVDNGSVEQLTLDLRRRYEKSSSQVKFFDLDVPFNFAEIVNYGVEQSTADHVVLLNNDIQIINFDWLESLLEHSQRPEIGAVGGKLYYPDDTIQHAGIVVGIGDYAGHPHKHEQGGFSGYVNRLNVVQNMSAVTGAMLMCKTAVYREVGGFNAEDFKIACNDVDFCLRLIERGYRNVFTPFAQAYHHESISRGYEDTPEKKARFEREKSLFQERHSTYLANSDPYYNKYLLLDREDVVPRPLD